MAFFGVSAKTSGGGGSLNPGGTGSGNANSIARWFGVGSNTLQGSSVYLDDSNNITGVNSLTVTTLIATTTITTGDNIIMLNDQVVGIPTQDAGIEVERGTSINSRCMWNETSDRWEGGIIGSLKKFLQNGDNVSELVNDAGYLTSFTETDPLSLHLNGLNWSATSPLNYSGTTLSIQQASGSQNGYLSSTDWTTFNNKVTDITRSKTLYVDKGRTDSYTADGTVLRPYTTIQSAVDYVKTVAVAGQDWTLSINTGQYVENVVLEGNLAFVKNDLIYMKDRSGLFPSISYRIRYPFMARVPEPHPRGRVPLASSCWVYPSPSPNPWLCNTQRPSCSHQR